MSKAFKVNIVTPEDTYYTGEAISLIAPGDKGYLGVLVDHAPLVTPLVEGDITLRLPDKSEKKFKMNSGFLEVSENQALILAENIQEAPNP